MTKKSLSELKTSAICSYCSLTASLHEQQATAPYCDFFPLFPPCRATTTCFSSPSSSHFASQSMPCEPVERAMSPFLQVSLSLPKDTTETEIPGKHLQKHLTCLHCSQSPPPASAFRHCLGQENRSSFAATQHRALPISQAN